MERGDGDVGGDDGHGGDGDGGCLSIGPAGTPSPNHWEFHMQHPNAHSDSIRWYR